MLYQSLAVCPYDTFIDALSFSAKNAGLLPAHFTIWREEKVDEWKFWMNGHISTTYLGMLKIR